MRNIKSHNLAQLLLQLRFTPEKKRKKQLDSAEKLVGIIDKNKEYPFDFICFRITGFHPTDTKNEVIKGDELLDELRIFISKLGGKLVSRATEQPQKVYALEELAEMLDVSAKTIYRWRKQGLVARKYIFDDGKRRLGFLQSSLDTFLRKNPDIASKAKNFTRLTDEQKQQIIAMAVKLTIDTNLSRYQIINRISAATGKSHETIRYTLMNYEHANPDKSNITKSIGVLEPTQAAEICRLYKQGCKVKELMKRFNRNKSSIYRIINQKRAKMLLARKIEYIPSDEFLQQGAEEKILARSVDSAAPSIHRDVEPSVLAGSSLPEYLQTIKDAPVLNREQEVELFRRYNFLKFMASQARVGLKTTRISGAKLTQIENYIDEAEEIKRRIIEVNLKLVVSVARKHTTAGAGLLDLVSEGNITLMRAVEKFDYTRGFRFSTFASWAIAKDFARKIPAQAARLDKAATASLASFQRDLRTEDAVDFAAIEQAHKSLAQVVEENLTERERYIILNRFGLLGSPIKKETKTLKQIGEELGYSKERIRQIELIALQKLRHSLSSEEFELLTG